MRKWVANQRKIWLALVLAFGSGALAQAQVSFTATQASQGQQIFQAQCAMCHGTQLQGQSGPPLKGDQFLNKWQKNSLEDFYYIMSTTMPLTAPGSLSQDQYLAILAHVLSANGFKPGDKPLARADLKDLKFSTVAQAAQGPATVVSAPLPVKITGPTQAELNNSEFSLDSWLMNNKGYMSQRFATAMNINRSNAKNLKRVCTLDLGDLGGFQATPVVYKGVMFITKENRTIALDATNCKKFWEHTYTPSGPVALATNRGVAIYNGMLFRGTGDAHIIALDANTGQLLWDKKIEDSTNGYFTSSAPIVWNDLVFMGEAGADWGIKAKMHAFNVKDGSEAWSFDVIPTGDQEGANTWENADSTTTGGGSMWTSYSLDRESGMIYISIGNPAPDFAANYRPGANLFTNSMIVLDAKTGKLNHYYQQLPNDDKDYDTSVAPLLFRLNGKLYASVPTKAGFLFTYDESTKQQVYKVPTVTIKNADQPPTAEGTPICPNYTGGSQWSGPSFSPVTRLLYVNSIDWCGVVKLGEVRYVRGQLFFGGSMQLDPIESSKGYTTAFDALSGRMLWRHTTDGGIRKATPVTSTAGGLVLVGDTDGTFYVLDANNGSVLFQENIDKAPIGAGIATYVVGGKQYIAVPAGNTSRGATGVNAVPSRIAIFTLP
ncbi:MAG TPA: PQQ-binding-like beta-propeller repeat protein [Meiothermus sp.]|nr:PQQ-binding-like beta-propeller repeat protein [Meiothermus sp.]